MNRDHSLRRQPKKGRYEGDLFAELSVLPGEKKPFTVRVWVWRRSRSWSIKTTEQLEASWAWWDAFNNSYAEAFPFERDFRKQEQAIDYLNQVRGYADAPLVRKRISAAREASRSEVS